VDDVDSVEYIGWMEEILELNYRSHCCIVVLCSWIPGTLGIRNAKVEKDKYGFLFGELHQNYVCRNEVICISHTVPTGVFFLMLIT
jgi:hypothetical protein